MNCRVRGFEIKYGNNDTVNTIQYRVHTTNTWYTYNDFQIFMQILAAATELLWGSVFKVPQFVLHSVVEFLGIFFPLSVELAADGGILKYFYNYFQFCSPGEEEARPANQTIITEVWGRNKNSNQELQHGPRIIETDGGPGLTDYWPLRWRSSCWWCCKGRAAWSCW